MYVLRIIYMVQRSNPSPPHGHGEAIVLSPPPVWCGGGVVLSPSPPCGVVWVWLCMCIVYLYTHIYIYR